jgi:dienelactone hydrolase
MKYFLHFVVLTILSLTTVAHAEVQTQEIEYTQNGTTLKGYFAYDSVIKEKRPGILVIHEWWGHNEHARDRARMLAKIGYTALAVDMYGNGKVADHPKKASEFMNAAFKDWGTSQARFNKAKKVLQSHKTVDAERIGAIGFCFGGAVSLRMAFHSALPLQPTITNMKASVLVINGSQDGFLKPETVGSFSSQMMAANADFTYMSLTGTKHSFTNKQADEFGKKFNIPSLQYNKQSDERSWAAMQKFFQRVFKQ